MERLRRSFDDDLAGHAVATPDGDILACNAEFARIIGTSSVEEAMAINLHQLEPEPGAFIELLHRLKETPVIPAEELSFVRRDGTPSQVLARLTATRDDEGHLSEVRVYLVDISERFREELKLRAFAERLHLAELATQDPLWDWDVPNARVHWNDAAVRRFRYQNEEVRSTIDWHLDRIHPEDRERVLRGIERAIFGIDTAWSDEYRVRRGDGTYATVFDRAHVVRNGRGEPLRVVGSIVDITELRASEASHRFLADATTALEAALDVRTTANTLARLCVPQFADFAMVDLLEDDGSVCRVAVAHRQPGLEPALEPGRAASADADDATAPVEAIRSGDVECVTGTVEAGDVTQRLAIADEAGGRGFVTIPIVSRDRRLGALTLGFTSPRRCLDPLQLMTAKDLAARGGQALNNARLYEVAQNAIQSRNEVLGIVSHDLRVPVNTIVATLALLSDSVPERRADVRGWLDILQRATTQVRDLIEDLLDASRLESHQFKVDRRAADVTALIHEAAETLGPLAATKNITLETRPDPDLPLVDADSPKVVRVIGNLIGNAIKFSPRDSRILVRAVEHAGELRVSVHDQGPGIPPDQLDRVFDRFWQGRENDRRGSGLGLSIARGIVEAHGGRIWVESRVDHGSTFTFTLPVLQRNGKAGQPSAGQEKSAHRISGTRPRRHHPDASPRGGRPTSNRPVQV